MSCVYSVLVVGTAIVLVPAADQSAAYTDLTNSILLAQLAANKKIEKAPDIDWYDAYVEFLDNYWLRHARARQEWPVAQESSECLGDWVITAMFKDAVDKTGAAAATLHRLTCLSGTEPALGLLRGHMQRASAGELRDVRLLVVVAYTPTSTSSVYMQFQTDKALDSNPLAQRYRIEDVKGTVCMRYAGTILSESLYGPVRDAITLKVRDRLEDNVKVLKLKEDDQATESCAAD
jgi:hypothetical protein